MLTLNKEKKMSDESKNEKKFVIARTYSAGVFAGYLESHNDKHVILSDARRIWYWDGAASLSQLAVDGTSKPKNCKFPVAVPRVELMECIELLDVTGKAKKSIEGVPVWSE
jgi:hypothetical protein